MSVHLFDFRSAVQNVVKELRHVSAYEPNQLVEGYYLRFFVERVLYGVDKEGGKERRREEIIVLYGTSGMQVSI